MRLIETGNFGSTETPPDNITEAVTEKDEEIFSVITSVTLNDEQTRRIVHAENVYPLETCLMAVHWHPEFIPLDLILARVANMFPRLEESLIIPTQHNVLMRCHDFSGVEVDCFSSGFNQKVQLLLHFKNERLEQADVFKSMLRHTFKYRSSQLFEYLNALTLPNEDFVRRAAEDTGAGPSLIRFAAVMAQKVKTLVDRHIGDIPEDMLKNKLIRNFLDEYRPVYGDRVIQRAQVYLAAVKQLVKAGFSNQYFYEAREIIEEARSLRAGVVIPHPEQFWPILLADYDVDGVEVWNPQSRRYTEFLVSVLNEANKKRYPHQKPLLIFMGDDTHLSEKVKDPAIQDPAKAGREVGFQPAWRDFSIQKQLICGNITKEGIIREYRDRLMG